MADKEVSGYIHKVSPVKTSKRQNRYFNAIIQTAEDEFHDIVCFNADRRNQLKSLEDTKAAVKISNITKTPGKRTSNSDDIQIDKRAKITSVALDFPSTTPSVSRTVQIQDIKTINSHQQVCILFYFMGSILQSLALLT